ncbi:MAG: FxLYD domain-containing protein [Candidatus Bathyarchaeia archaeon]
MKKVITAIIIVSLIMAAFSMLFGPTVKADSSEVKILSYSWYVAPINTILAENVGDLIAVGEIQNVGSNVLGSVFIVGFAYNSTGDLLDSNEAPLYVYDVLPEQKAPFYIDFIPENSVTQDNSWVQDVTNVTLEVGYVSDLNTTQYSGLTSTGSSGSNVDGSFTVTGLVQNNGSETTGNVWVDTTFYNASGSVVALNYTDYLSSSFAPGDSAAFIATPTDDTGVLSSEITNYSLLIQSEPLSTSETPTPSQPPSTTPTPSQTASAHPTQSPATMSAALTYGLAVAVVAVVVILVAWLFLRKNRKNAKFEPPPPPPPPPPP